MCTIGGSGGPFFPHAEAMITTAAIVRTRRARRQQRYITRRKRGERRNASTRRQRGNRRRTIHTPFAPLPPCEHSPLCPQPPVSLRQRRRVEGASQCSLCG